MRQETAFCKNKSFVLVFFFSKRIYKASDVVKRDCPTLTLTGLKPYRPQRPAVGTL
jgi:hypothetical protein